MTWKSHLAFEKVRLLMPERADFSNWSVRGYLILQIDMTKTSIVWSFSAWVLSFSSTSWKYESWAEKYKHCLGVTRDHNMSAGSKPLGLVNVTSWECLSELASFMLAAASYLVESGGNQQVCTEFLSQVAPTWIGMLLPQQWFISFPGILCLNLLLNCAVPHFKSFCLL